MSIVGLDKEATYIYHMYNVFDVSKIQGFNWDRWNLNKSYKKHGITVEEAEEIFLDEEFGYERDIKHSQTEKRFIGIGRTGSGTVLFVVFTVRGRLIRIISVRKANKKERKKYEET